MLSMMMPDGMRMRSICHADLVRRVALHACLLLPAFARAQPAAPLFASVWSDSSAVVVTSASDSTWIMVATPWKSYTVHGDSASIAAWADSAALAAATFTDTSGVHCTLRLDQHGVLTASAPGSSSSIILASDSTKRLNALLHGYRRAIFLPASPEAIHEMAEPWPDSSPKFEVEHGAQPMKGNVMPRYPETLLHQRLSGVVIAQFVVDTMGRAVMRTVKMLESPHPLMSFAVYTALGPMRFTPATIGDRKVPELVQQPITFGFSHRSLW